MKPVCIVMVGLPATGKSTRANELSAADLDAFVYSTDKFIEDAAKHFGVTYDEAFEDNIRSATANNEIWLKEAIAKKANIIWDQTNLGVKKRRKIINRMKQVGYQVQCICILPPEPAHISDQTDWKHRLNNRPGKSIPSDIMYRMLDSYVRPTIEEGFDGIGFYNMHGALIAVE